MIWLTWRQFRIQTWITVGALAVLGILLIINGRSIADAYAAGVAPCQSDCAAAIESFLQKARNGISGNIYNLTTAIMYLVPALIGAFWGAPLIARELEAGTHRLVWNQSVPRTRWLITKLAMIATATIATTGLLSWAVTNWAHYLDDAAGNRITPLVFGARGIVPIGYALFAFALGVTAGMLIRRTVPAMAVTLAGYVAVAAAMPLWIRAHLVPPTHTTQALNVETLQDLMIQQNGKMEVIGDDPLSAWVLTNQTLKPSGQLFTGPTNTQYCGPGKGQCEEWIDSLGLRQDVEFHPDSHFWPLQWIETGILVAVTGLLIGFCFWWIRRRAT